jgi:hypothetical protein
MNHLAHGRTRLRERMFVWVMLRVEHCVLSLLPRCPLRRRLLALVDQKLKRRHLCNLQLPSDSRRRPEA